MSYNLRPNTNSRRARQTSAHGDASRAGRLPSVPATSSERARSCLTGQIHGGAGPRTMITDTSDIDSESGHASSGTQCHGRSNMKQERRPRQRANRGEGGIASACHEDGATLRSVGAAELHELTFKATHLDDEKLWEAELEAEVESIHEYYSRQEEVLKEAAVRLRRTFAEKLAMMQAEDYVIDNGWEVNSDYLPTEVDQDEIEQR
ncbi:hypothetical protein F5148DRAFT_1283366 [Russula earlei]|uniref:Uncharacterized protein n=1 Tax=Russula earlei TaxID=71964 RepID=A0ACC0UC13_9AGAM|nr:hypothetical protein F5148DRAFT_1283366 [Russula earlei]